MSSENCIQLCKHPQCHHPQVSLKSLGGPPWLGAPGGHDPEYSGILQQTSHVREANTDMEKWNSMEKQKKPQLSLETSAFPSQWSTGRTETGTRKVRTVPSGSKWLFQNSAPNSSRTHILFKCAWNVYHLCRDYIWGNKINCNKFKGIEALKAFFPHHMQSK